MSVTHQKISLHNLKKFPAHSKLVRPWNKFGLIPNQFTPGRGFGFGGEGGRGGGLPPPPPRLLFLRSNKKVKI